MWDVIEKIKRYLKLSRSQYANLNARLHYKKLEANQGSLKIIKNYNIKILTDCLIKEEFYNSTNYIINI